MHRIEHFAHIGQTHGRPIAVPQDDVGVVGCNPGLVIRAHLPGAGGVFHKTLGAVGIVAADGYTHIFQREAIGRQPVRVQLDPHGGQRTATDADLANAINLRQPLRQHGGGRVVHLPAGERV